MKWKRITSIVCVVALILSSTPIWLAEVEEEHTQEDRHFPDGPPGGDGFGCQQGVPGYEPWYYYVGDMVNAWCGNLLLPQVDLSVGARGYQMQIVRAYNSHNSLVNGPLGYGWTYNYNLYFQNLGNLVYHDGDGSAHTFSTIDGSNFTSPAGKSLNVTRDLSMLITLREKTGTQYSFNSNNKLTLITDQFANTLNVTYDNSSRLSSISDDSNLMLNFTYNGTLISSITDALNRTVQYSYDVYGNLVNVTYPNNGSIQYSYYSDHTMNYTIDQVGKKMRFTYEPVGIGLSKVKYVNYSYVEGGSESTPYAAYTLTYGSNYTAVKNARAYDTNISLDSVGHPTKITGAEVGSIFSDLYGPGEALEEPTSWDKTVASCGKCKFGFYTCERRTNMNPPISAGCSGCQGGKTVASCFWPRPAEYTFRAFSSRSEVISIDWDSNYDIRNLTDGLDNTYNFTYNSIHDLLSVVDPSSNTTSYGWQVTATYGSYITLLANVTNPRGYSGVYLYDSAMDGLGLNSYQDALGNITYYSRGFYGLLGAFTDARGKIYQFSYDAHGFLVDVTNPLDEITSFGRDLAGRLINVTSPGMYITEYSYDEADNMLAVEDASGNTTDFTYNLRGDLVGIRDTNGYWTNYTTDTILGKVNSETDPSGNSTTYSYDACGNLVSFTSKRNYSTSFGYDAYNRLANVTDSLGNMTEIEYNSDGTISNVTDRLNHLREFGHDSLGRLTNVTDPSGNVTKVTYDEIGNIVAIVDARNNQVTMGYDALNRLVSMIDPMGNLTAYEYDAVGNAIRFTDQLSNSYESEYDDIGRLIKRTDPLNQSTQFVFDAEGHLVNMTDANSHSSVYEYDAVGRVVKVTNAVGNSTSLSYDAVGNLISVTDAENHVTNMTYDSLNRVTCISSPSGKMRNLSYDADGNLVERVSPDGNTVSYVYDALGRLTTISYPNGVNATFQYDAEGQVIQISNGSGYYENRTYNSIGLLSSLQYGYGPLDKSFLFSYDEVGNRISVGYSDGTYVNYSYDAGNRLIGISDWANNNWTLEHNALGRRIGLEYPNGINTTYSFDNAGRLTNVLVKSPSNATLLNTTYGYDSIGNVVSFSDGLGNSTTYAYDAHNQLVQTNDSATGLINYTYDGVGNLLSKVQGSNVTLYTHNADNQLISDGSTNYSFDNNGNVITRCTGSNYTNFSYDYDNLLTNVTLPDSSIVQYGYSPLGFLISWSAQGETSYFLNVLGRTGEFEDILVAYNSTGVMLSKYVYGPGPDEPLESYNGSSRVYYHSDLLGSVRLTTDSSGSVLERFGYDDFGYPSLSNSSVSYSHLFAGRAWDESSELYHFRARWYDPSIGRFMSEDPMGFVDGANLYTYAGNNPISRIDPSGCWWWYVAACEGLMLASAYQASRDGDLMSHWCHWAAHAYVGCQMHRGGCGYWTTYFMAWELEAIYPPILQDLDWKDVKATMVGWDRYRRGGRTCFLWWCRYNWSCKRVALNYFPRDSDQHQYYICDFWQPGFDAWRCPWPRGRCAEG